MDAYAKEVNTNEAGATEKKELQEEREKVWGCKQKINREIAVGWFI